MMEGHILFVKKMLERVKSTEFEEKWQSLYNMLQNSESLDHEKLSKVVETLKRLKQKLDSFKCSTQFLTTDNVFEKDDKNEPAHNTCIENSKDFTPVHNQIEEEENDKEVEMSIKKSNELSKIVLKKKKKKIFKVSPLKIMSPRREGIPILKIKLSEIYNIKRQKDEKRKRKLLQKPITITRTNDIVENYQNHIQLEYKEDETNQNKNEPNLSDDKTEKEKERWNLPEKTAKILMEKYKLKNCCVILESIDTGLNNFPVKIPNQSDRKIISKPFEVKEMKDLPSNDSKQSSLTKTNAKAPDEVEKKSLVPTKESNNSNFVQQKSLIDNIKKSIRMKSKKSFVDNTSLTKMNGLKIKRSILKKEVSVSFKNTTIKKQSCLDNEKQSNGEILIQMKMQQELPSISNERLKLCPSKEIMNSNLATSVQQKEPSKNISLPMKSIAVRKLESDTKSVEIQGVFNASKNKFPQKSTHEAMKFSSSKSKELLLNQNMPNIHQKQMIRRTQPMPINSTQIEMANFKNSQTKSKLIIKKVETLASNHKLNTQNETKKAVQCSLLKAKILQKGIHQQKIQKQLPPRRQSLPSKSIEIVRKNADQKQAEKNSIQIEHFSTNVDRFKRNSEIAGNNSKPSPLKKIRRESISHAPMVYIPFEIVERIQNNKNRKDILLSAEFTMKKLRPWLQTIEHRKILKNCDEMLKNEFCLSAIFKCMGSSCSFFTVNSTLFFQHLKLHETYQVSDSMNYSQCAYCNFNDTSPKNLINHIISDHGSSRYQCHYCFYRCYDFHIYTHMKMFHTMKPEIIIGCKPLKYLKVEEELLNVWSKFLTVCRPIICLVCKIKFYNIKHFAAHFFSYDYVPPSTCIKCKFEVNRETVIDHLKNCHKFGNLNCGFCTFGSDSLDSITLHLANVHPSKLLLYFDRSIESSEFNAQKIKPTCKDDTSKVITLKQLTQNKATKSDNIKVYKNLTALLNVKNLQNGFNVAQTEEIKEESEGIIIPSSAITVNK